MWIFSHARFALYDWQIHRAVLAFELGDVADDNCGVAAPARFTISEKYIGQLMRHALAPERYSTARKQ
jgi:hypothetical protein